MKPVIALVGRPNVGKSTLFNRLTRTRDALVANQPGLTRDRHYGVGRIGPREYLVVDTGGLEPVAKDGIYAEMAKQSRQAIVESDLVLFLVDGRQGVTPHDHVIAAELRKAKREVILVVNKTEGYTHSMAAADFFELGLGEPETISASHGDGVRQLMDIACEKLPVLPEDEEGGRRIKVAIAGRPNVGKSTLFNRLIGKKLALVDDQPGVTRDRRFGDAVIAGLEFQIVDTAGWEDEDAESLPGRMRKQTEVSLEGADAAMFVFDSRIGLTPLDEEIARWLREQAVPVILVANKAEGSQGDAGIFESFSLGFGEPAAISAEHGEGIADLFDHLWPIIGAKAEAAEIEAEIDEEDEEALLAGPLKLAIVGRPNAGKSTLINRLLGEDRLLTGPEAGITRDSIAIDWEWHDPRSGEDREIRLIDTAG
ncbi:GTPase, partial [Limnobacter sp. UBA1615]|uniref:GTPase n=1 Tax=Limnobacter sp. UBA1615 TaxID=1946757 RepID=UPI0025BCDABE